MVIGGPCAAESREQLFETARRLAGTRIDYFRAGIWKARTRPGSFEGIGDEALEWLRAAGDAYGYKTATEVAHGRHVEAALKAGIDLLWVGARTTVNPFSVQELADAARGTDVPILIKNPTSSDIGLWIGAFERFSQAGVRALGGIHRGVSTVNSAPYRNAPMWSMVIELRRLFPELPIITDPSHICGRRDLLQDIAQRAMDLGMDGLMIESHPRPDSAWSDAAQQVTPERLAEILSELVIRTPDSGNAEFQSSLEELRERIDQVDHELIAALGTRMGIVERIAEQKRRSNVTTLQVTRWRALLADRVKTAGDHGLEAGFVKAVYEVIHQESIRRQNEIISNVETRTIVDPGAGTSE
jgi:chorismate mutase